MMDKCRPSKVFSIVLFIYVILAIFGCAGSLLLWAGFSSCSKGGLLTHCGMQVSRCIPQMASLAEHGL